MELKVLAKEGKIEDLRLQPRFQMEVNEKLIGRYTADFRYWDLQGEKPVEVVEDVKGGKATQTEAFRLRWKLCQALFPEYDFRLT
jgi:hypothetical protein